MSLEEKLKIFKEKGWSYNAETGEVFSHTGKLIQGSSRNGYIYCSFRYNDRIIVVLSHQLCWYLYYNEVPKIIDHINRHKKDNRISNLRIVSKSQNAFNTQAKGYSFDKSKNKYQARIGVNNKQIYLGLFNTPEEARNAYLEVKQKYHII